MWKSIARLAVLPLATFALGVLAAVIWMRPPALPAAAVPQSYPGHPQLACDINSDEMVDGLLAALSRDPEASNQFLELGGNCPDDPAMWQLMAAVEIAFPRTPARRGAGAENIVAIPLTALGPPYAQRLALAMELLAYGEKRCGASRLVAERLAELGLHSEKISTFLVSQESGEVDCGAFSSTIGR